ncbi:MAG: resolvase [Pseudobutyrivibrio sp.]|uniref:DUF7674 family protein n=1 Tax=Pseudobutyrivibrio sp. TaxID=2014367 RepID=UPI0025DF966E|nr:resolvase [Pseudobutyrivibrio sp.]MBQ6463886.1 resolvase [Pseudobutyrivibrio sp.]
MIRFNEFINSMEDFFPETRDTIDIALSESMGEMDTIVIEDIIMPKVISLLRKNEDKEKLTSLFGYFEDVVEQADDYLSDIFAITVLEILGNTKEDLNVAKIYMGRCTAKKQREADIDIGRIID